MTDTATAASEEIKFNLKAASNLLKEAISLGAETVYCLLKRWNLEQRWQAIFQLESDCLEALEQLTVVAPDWMALC